MTSLTTALTVGKLYPVFPCGSNKRPYFSNKELEQLLGVTLARGQGGCKIASQDPEVIKALWEPNKKALVGVHTEGLVCIDWDAYKGEAAAERWMQEHPHLYEGRIHNTKSGGKHVIFRLPPGIKLPPKIDGIDTVDIKSGVGSYFIWPTKGSGYTVEQDIEPPLLPQSLVDAIGAKYEGAAPTRDWTPNSATDDELIAAVLSGGDYHAALASLTMRWANRVGSDGQRPSADNLINRACDLLKKSKPKQPDRQQRRDDLLEDVGGELSRMCEGAWDRAHPVDPFDQLTDEDLAGLVEPDEEDDWAGISLDPAASTLFSGDPAASQEAEQWTPIDLPGRRLLSSSSTKPEPRQWLHGRYLITGHMTMTAAPGGTGKSTAVMTELLEIACQQNVTGQRLWRPAKVLYINGEDPVDEIERRLYACVLKHGFDTDLINERFWYYSGRDFEGGLHFVEAEDRDVVVRQEAVDAIERLIDESGAEIVCIDPLSSFHGVNENSNSEVRTLMDVLRALSHRKGVSFHMVHHSVKEAIQNKTLGAESARGASAFLDACRIVRTLRHLTKDENKRAGLPETDKSVVRTVIGKGNMTQAGDGTFMFRLQGIDLDNGNDIYPEGDNVGVIEAYDADISPDSFDDLAKQVEAARVLLELSDGEYRVYPGSGPRHGQWLGHFMMRDLGVEVAADMDPILSLLEAEGYLRIEKRRDTDKGRTYAVYIINTEQCRGVIEAFG